ncbi:hypothetical protein ACVFYP_25880 [Roseomonas sp. F4]
MLIGLSLLAGIAALFAMASVALSLLPALGIGLAGLGAAAGFGLLSLVAGLGATGMALGQERTDRLSRS